jgi:hypothetical protein
MGSLTVFGIQYNDKLKPFLVFHAAYKSLAHIDKHLQLEIPRSITPSIKKPPNL